MKMQQISQVEFRIRLVKKNDGIIYGFQHILPFKIWKQIWKTWQWPQDWKRSVFIPIPKKGNAKECSNYRTNTLISHASKVMLKILQARLQQYVNREVPDVQAGFRKGRGATDQIANICWIIEKAREFQKTSISALLTMPHQSILCSDCSFARQTTKYDSLCPNLFGTSLLFHVQF